MNGIIPNLTGGGPERRDRRCSIAALPPTAVTPAIRRRLGPRPAAAHRRQRTCDDWALNDEAIKNLGYMQLKKTHDAAMVLVERTYGEPTIQLLHRHLAGRPRGLTVAQRYPADYDGMIANVPIVNSRR